MNSDLKMYILVKRSVPLGIGIVSAVHAPLIAYLKYKDDLIFKDWLENSFKKVVCWVTDNEFESCKEMDLTEVITESKYENKETAIVCCPRKEWPRKFKYFPLVGSEIWDRNKK